MKFMDSSNCSSSFFVFVFLWLFFYLDLGRGLEVLLFLVRRRVEEVIPAVFAAVLSAADELWETVRLLSSCRASLVCRVVDLVDGLLPLVPSVWDSDIFRGGDIVGVPR